MSKYSEVYKLLMRLIAREQSCARINPAAAQMHNDRIKILEEVHAELIKRDMWENEKEKIMAEVEK